MRARRLGSLRFFGGFVCGAAAATASCVASMRFYWRHVPDLEPHPDEVPQKDMGRYGFPVTGAEMRSYANHVLSYDQVKKTPRWVAEHLSNAKLQGSAERKHCKFRPDPGVPELFTAHNEDYLGSGWSRGHMAPAGDNKFSEQAMAETFYLSNIVPQNYENNAGFWNRLEMYCRNLTEKFEDVWVISGPLTLPEVGADGKKTISYKLIGKRDVAVPTHLYKVVLAQRSLSSPKLALGAFVVPNQPIGYDHPLTEFQVSLMDMEKLTGLRFFPKVDPVGLQNLCEVDSCRLLDFKEFTLYITGHKVKGANTTAKLEKSMSDMKKLGITPDDYLLKLYQQKREELQAKEAAQGRKT
ncbi:nuclease EXOG, mitochondrial-like [Brienomyrus brachyistius]|uniref:nuclease EXOG, mitochondrial-like n=1 Tax=Brienomyrus brachyistius TaxID=42636 RepID=UPI0020B2DD9E|nr:nuclease EXOG, mitochondrial-like [Brienomyrus brachyistius]